MVDTILDGITFGWFLIGAAVPPLAVAYLAWLTPRAVTPLTARLTRRRMIRHLWREARRSGRVGAHRPPPRLRRNPRRRALAYAEADECARTFCQGCTCECHKQGGIIDQPERLHQA